MSCVGTYLGDWTIRRTLLQRGWPASDSQRRKDDLREDDAAEHPRQTTSRAATDERIEAIEAIRTIADRSEALNRLLAAALALAARAADLRLDPSWTVRDAMRHIPTSWPFRAELARLARDAELAHFGGRAVSEDQFEGHLRAMTPVFREKGA